MKAPGEKKAGQPFAATEYNALQSYAKALEQTTGSLGGNVSVGVKRGGMQLEARQAGRPIAHGIAVLGSNTGQAGLGAWCVAEITGQVSGGGIEFYNSPVLGIEKATQDDPLAWCVVGGSALSLNAVGLCYTSGVVPCYVKRPAGVTGAWASPTAAREYLLANDEEKGVPVIWEAPQDAGIEGGGVFEAMVLLQAPRPAPQPPAANAFDTEFQWADTDWAYGWGGSVGSPGYDFLPIEIGHYSLANMTQTKYFALYDGTITDICAQIWCQGTPGAGVEWKWFLRCWDEAGDAFRWLIELHSRSSMVTGDVVVTLFDAQGTDGASNPCAMTFKKGDSFQLLGSATSDPGAGIKCEIRVQVSGNRT